MTNLINLSDCVGINATQFEQTSCVAKEPVFVIVWLVAFGLIFLGWFIFGLAIKVNKSKLLIGQGNYWIHLIFLVLGIIVLFFGLYFPFWFAWVT